MTLKARVGRLEAASGMEGEIGLREIIAVSMADAPDPELEVRIARSAIGRLIVATACTARARGAT
jgi:hypothetical protein